MRTFGLSDPSPVLNLARIGRLDFLPSLYQQVLIPSAVYGELTAYNVDLPPAIDLASAPWLIVAAPKDLNRIQELREDLDPGEAEAIVLAIECRGLWMKGAGVALPLLPALRLQVSPAAWPERKRLG